MTTFKGKYPICYKINILETIVITKSSQFNFHFLQCGICDENEFLDNDNRSDWHGVSLFIIKNSSKKPTSFNFSVDMEDEGNMLFCNMTTYLQDCTVSHFVRSQY